MDPPKPSAFGPPNYCDAPDTSNALLIIAPGALLSPPDYTDLIQAIQRAIVGKVRLWVAVMAIDWRSMIATKPDEHADAFAAPYEAALQAAKEAGCPIQLGTSGKSDNIYVAMHSYAAVWTPNIMSKVGGCIFLASQQRMFPFEAVPVWQTLETWGRPILHVGGMLDGQTRPMVLLPTLQEALAMMERFGKRYVASRKPVIMIPDINHAFFSNGEPRTNRGDIVVDDITLQDAAAGIAQPIADFLTVHCSTDAVQCGTSVDDLVHQFEATLQMMNPLSIATGRGNLELSYNIVAPMRPKDTSLLGVDLPERVIPAAFGAERIPAVKQYYAHPGEVAAAEEFTKHVQNIMLGEVLQAEAAEKLRVAVTVHTDQQTFITSQPKVARVQDEFILVVHCYLHRPALSDMSLSSRRPVNPEYFMKLKKKSIVEMSLGLVSQPPVEEVSVSGAVASEHAYEAARKLLPEDVKQRYQSRGKKLMFKPDIDVTHDIKSPVEWIQEKHIQFTQHTAGKREVEVCCPCVSTESHQLPSYEYGVGRFIGNHYIKCCSVGWMAEWISTEALKTDEIVV